MLCVIYHCGGRLVRILGALAGCQGGAVDDGNALIQLPHAFSSSSLLTLQPVELPLYNLDSSTAFMLELESGHNFGERHPKLSVITIWDSTVGYYLWRKPLEDGEWSAIFLYLNFLSNRLNYRWRCVPLSLPSSRTVTSHCPSVSRTPPLNSYPTRIEALSSLHISWEDLLIHLMCFGLSAAP